MFHATLIVGGNNQKRLDEAEKLTGVKLDLSPDILIVSPDPSITIATVRRLNQFLARIPLSAKNNICLITDAAAITIPAQNALLKTLEEPPQSAQIILLADSTAKLLPTVVSRCQLINLGDNDQLSEAELKVQEKIFKQIVAAKMGERIALAATFSAEAKNFCANQLKFLRLELRQENVARIKRLQASLKYLDANVNPKLVLEQLLLNW